MKDFFISHTKVDESKAIEVASFLESLGYTVIIDVWDFRPGDNIIERINFGLAK